MTPEKMSEYNVLNREAYPREMPEVGAPTVNFSPKTGVLYFSKGACELMDLKAGDRLEVLQDKSDTIMYGFRKTDNEAGFKIRPKRVGMCFAATKLVRDILLSFGKWKCTTVLIGSEVRDGAWWLITRSIK